MDGAEYRRIREAMGKAGLFRDYGHIAEFLGMIRRGEQKMLIHGPQKPTAMLLSLMAAMDWTPEKVERRIAHWRK